MTKLLKKAKSVLLVGLAAVTLSTSTYGANADDNVDQSTVSSTGGTYCKNAVTGETYCIPEPDIDTHSDETFGFSPGYNPFAAEDNNGDNLIEPYYTDHGRTRVDDPQYNEKCRNTVCVQTKYINKDYNELIMITTATGFLIGPNAVATAGHVLFDKTKHGGDHWITESTIIPAYNSGTDPKPFGTAEGIEYRCGLDWANNRDSSDDWGIIILDKNIGNDIGWLGLQWQSTPYSPGTSVHVNGYPDKVYGRKNYPYDQYTRSGTVKGLSTTNLLESRDMFVSKGDSGGPCYIKSDKYGYTAIGISVSGTGSTDSDGDIYDESFVNFRTIDKSLYTKLIEFRTSTL